MTTISIVVLAQHASLLQACLSGIRKYTTQPYELIVVNDGNVDEVSSVAEQERGTPAIRLIAAPERIGVAKGYNLGAAHAGGSRVVFLRDHVVVGKEWLDGLNECLDEHPGAAAAGPVAPGVSGRQRIDLPAEMLLKLDRKARALVSPQFGTPVRTTRLLSFLMIVRSEAFARLGGFDEQFSLESYEDDDFCYRALLEGYTLYIARSSVVQYASPPALFPEDPNWYSRQLETNRKKAMDKWGAPLTSLLLDWKQRISVSLCMIVKNEQSTLERCLSSVADLVDEIVIVDTGSTDRTKELAAGFGARLFDFEWVHDFSRARNYAFSQAAQDYILWLDADDVLLPDDRERLRSLISAMPAHVDAVSMHYVLGKDAYGNVTSSLRRHRLVRREMGFRWIGVVHEYLEVFGSILQSDISVTHDRMHTASDRNLHIYEQKLQQGETFGPRDTYYYANELFDHSHWEKAAAQYERLLTMDNVWVEDRIGACGRSAECYMHLGQLEKAKAQALKSFVYALPRAENCCRLGLFHLREKRYREAAWWYELASGLEKPNDTSALLVHACWTWLPHLQLCVCYDRLGDYERAYRENELAAAYIPNDSTITANRAYLTKMLQTNRG